MGTWSEARGLRNSPRLCEADLSFEAHNEVWKGDREHIRNTIVGERYQELVTLGIKESRSLHNLQNEVAREELQQAAKSQRN